MTRQRMLYGLKRRAMYWERQAGRLQLRPEFRQFTLYDPEYKAPSPPSTPVKDSSSRKALWSAISLALMKHQPMQVDSLPHGCVNSPLFSRLKD